ncbi:MAG: sensor protein, partial [Gemmatimonadetes bacterium]|nr:sensor protein [Gemmatimonadota bacterium]
RARLIVRGLLEQVRAEPPRADRIAPDSLVAPLVSVFTRECRERGIEFEWRAEPGLPMLEGDAAGLEQVLTNLLRNAAQATPAGGRIALALRARGRLIEFVVQDSGPGIPADLLDRIFEPFFTTRPSGEGTGLGLSVSQTIVRKHRGTLVAENVPMAEGGGARFVVALPLVDRRAREREPLDDEGVNTAPVAGSGRRILVVEDEATIRVALRRYLEPRGWIVELAADGPAALAAVERGAPHAVLCDVRIGVLSGMELYDRLVAGHPALKERILLVSGDAGAPDVVAFRERTGAVVLQKPFELAALAARLDRAGGPSAA